MQVVARWDLFCHRQALRKPIVDVVLDAARWCRRGARECRRLTRRMQRRSGKAPLRRISGRRRVCR
ncbi:hypothetical protein EYC55_21205 [Xanthomonas oryzae]|nr:hypothetical protein EYR26_02735 [Xanthomonas oryzae]QBG97405.1 hypothetical protein EYC55_21205 [Xanthomonas oryzae]QBG98503.1 hypothetical protein EYC56_02405 [Xanthomonas oryzae]